MSGKLFISAWDRRQLAELAENERKACDDGDLYMALYWSEKLEEAENQVFGPRTPRILPKVPA